MEHSDLGGMTMLHLSPESSGISVEQAEEKIVRDRDSKGLQGNNIFLDTTGELHIGTHRVCESIHKIWTKSNQTKSQRRGSIEGLTLSQEAILD